MAKRLYARRYAQAVFEIALERNELDKWQSDLREIVSLGEDTEVIELLQAPKLRFEDKARLIAERLPDVNPLALNLVYLLVARNRLGILRDIADEYERLFNSYRGIEEAEIITAVPLAEDEKLKLKESIEEIVGKKVIIKTRVDPSLLGGVVIRVGDKLIDGSTRSRLLALKKELVGVGS